MLWFAVDVLIALIALTSLVLVALSLWRRLKAFSSVLTDAGEAVGAASDRLADAQAEGPQGR